VIAKERGRSCWAADLLIASRGGSIRLHAASGAAAALIELIDLERECCAWIQFSVTRDPSAGVAESCLPLTEKAKRSSPGCSSPGRSP